MVLKGEGIKRAGDRASVADLEKQSLLAVFWLFRGKGMFRESVHRCRLQMS
jgi:hypothetical protein